MSFLAWLRRRREDELEEEIAAHLRMAEHDRMEAGLSAKEARQQGLKEFGNRGLVKEAVRQAWGFDWLGAVMSDMHFGMRSLLKRPAATAVLVATLASGIGAATAVFSLAQAELFSGPPYPNGRRIISVFQSQPEVGDMHLGASTAEFLDYKRLNRTCTTLAGYEATAYDVIAGGKAERVSGVGITSDLLAVLGSKPFLGRAFRAQDDRYGAPRVAILSFGFWQSRYGASKHVLGTTIRLDEKQYTVVGVMPRDFSFPATEMNLETPPALWTPIQFSPDDLKDWAGSFDVSMLGLLKRSASVTAAQADMRLAAHEFQSKHPNVYNGLISRAQVAMLGDREAEAAKPALTLLGAGVFLVLLIAAVNAASLLLVQGDARRREFAVRSALGASTVRLLRQFLTEAMLLSAAACLTGVAFALAVLKLVERYGPNTLSRTLSAAQLHWPMLTMACAIAAVTGVVCGLTPLFQMKGRDLNESLKQGGRNSSADKRSLARRGWLVVTETALAAVLLIASALLIRSFVSLLDVQPGFDPHHVAIVRTSLDSARYGNTERRRRTEQQILERIRNSGFTESAAITTHVPLADIREIGFVVKGGDPNQYHWAENALVDGEYFGTMRIRLLQGRTFGSQDTPEGGAVAVVNKTLADHFLRPGPALGQVLLWGGRRLTIVGVVEDVHVKALDAAPDPMIYNSLWQVESGASTSAVFVIRYRGSAADVLSGVRSIIHAVDSGLPVFGAGSMEQVVRHSVAERAFTMYLLAGFAVFALLLALVGIYSVLAYAVTQRKQEWGVRLALGATPARLIRMVAGDGLRLTAVGLLAGGVLGWLVAASMSRLLFGIRPLDAMSFAGAGLLLLFSGLLASFIPAARAARIDPVSILRGE